MTGTDRKMVSRAAAALTDPQAAQSLPDRRLQLTRRTDNDASPGDPPSPSGLLGYVVHYVRGKPASAENLRRILRVGF